MAARPLSNTRKRRDLRKDEAAPHGGGVTFLLKVVEGPNIGKERMFAHEATIGRVEGNAIVLVDSGVSRQHARVYEQHGVHVLEDQGSANGTLLNGERISAPEVLREGDHITVHLTTFQFSTLAARKGDATREVAMQDSALQELDAAGTVESSAAFWKTRRGRIGLAIGAAIMTLGVAAYLLLHGGGQRSLFDQSNRVITYTEELFAENVFGYGEYDTKHRDRVVIEFPYRGGRVTLQYGAWGIDKVGEVVIRLNGKEVAPVPVTMERWVYGLRLTLPRDRLVNDKPNRLEFDNTRNPPNADPWEIYDLRIIQEAIPPPDTHEAYRNYELAKRAWTDREVEPGNLYKALVHLRRARDYLDGLPTKPDLYRHILSFIDQVDKALTQLFEEGLFTARRLMRVSQDLAGARRVLQSTLRYFDKEDYRYRELHRLLESVEKDLAAEE